MVCGNMEVEVVRSSYIDNLYDNHEDKVARNLSINISSPYERTNSDCKDQYFQFSILLALRTLGKSRL